MKRIFFVIILSTCIASANAQKGNNEIGIAPDLAFPTGNLRSVSNGGFGGSVIALYGFSVKKQQLLLSAGFIHFPVKEDYSGDPNLFYSTLPVMAGYRYTFSQASPDKGAYLEALGGYNFYTVGGSTTQPPIQKVRTKGSSFVYAAGIGYDHKGIDIGVRYQSAQVENSSHELNFIALRLGYSFRL